MTNRLRGRLIILTALATLSSNTQTVSAVQSNALSVSACRVGTNYQQENESPITQDNTKLEDISLITQDNTESGWMQAKNDTEAFLDERNVNTHPDTETALNDTLAAIKGFETQREKDNQLEQELAELEQYVENTYIYTIRDQGRVNQMKGTAMGQPLTDKEIDFAMHVPVTYFGDSLVAGSLGVFQGLFQNANGLGVGSMQIAPEGQQRLNELIAGGYVAPYVVINLGTNRGLTQQELHTMVQSLGDREIFFINTISYVGHKYEVAQEIKQIAMQYDHVYEIDFLSQEQPHYFSSDQIHHSHAGMVAKTQIIARTMYQTYYLP